jgi:3-phosphoshikimate 1-carboxyvinyltransferase
MSDAAAPALRLAAPGSKSLTQRALVLSALAAGESVLEGPLDSDDTRHLRAALRDLGAKIDELPDGRWRVIAGQLRAPKGALWCGDGGTVVRFLAPIALLLDGELVLDGSERLAERPLTALLEALVQLGVSVRALSPPRALPIALRAGNLPPAGTPVTVDASASSQFVSGLLMVGPLLPGGLDLRIEGGVSRPYVEMTLAAMRSRGADFVDEVTRCVVAPGAYRAGPFPIEGDWSAAAFLLAAGFISGREVVVPNVSGDSLQGDKAIAAFLAELARPRAHVFDLSACPDLVPPLAAAASFASHPSRIVGVAHARLKESDRLATLAQGFARAGILVDERPDGLEIAPATALRPARLEPRGDHRMAMAFGLLSLREPGIQSADPQCVSKSFPEFWDVLERFR